MSYINDTPQQVVNMIQENHVAQGLDPLQALRATQITLQAMIEAGLYPVVKSKAQKAMNEVNKRVKLEEEKRDTFKTPVIKKRHSDREKSAIQWPQRRAVVESRKRGEIQEVSG